MTDNWRDKLSYSARVTLEQVESSRYSDTELAAMFCRLVTEMATMLDQSATQISFTPVLSTEEMIEFAKRNGLIE